MSTGSGENKFLWPGFGENVRALIWMQERIAGHAAARETLAGLVPNPDDLPLEGLDLAPERLEAALSVHAAEWSREAEAIQPFYETFGTHLPEALWDELVALRRRLE